ncbi:hypothetical protein HG531_010949 [Fusarium graminearum]|nr:hypothetical protein HG531_010949 [Fusarium graminearum]
MAATTVRKSPYKDFLQPALHRRFTSTATVLLIVSYLQAIILDSWSSYFWAWFPIGPAGFRTAFIFTCGLAIVVLRIANYHVGLRTTGSGFQTLQTTVTQLKTYETLFWDTDRLVLGLSKGKNEKQPDALKLVYQAIPHTFSDSVAGAAAALPVALILYYAILRSFIWGWALMFLRIFYNLPKTNMLPPSWPSDLWLLFRCMEAGTLIHLIWNIGNFAFSSFMVKAPLKNGKPLTSESKDPNSSLLNGLKSKKLSIKAFAMWELAYIAQGFDTRRQAIYEDIDRKDGPMWSQVYSICLDVIKSIETRVDTYGKAPDAPLAAPAAEPKQRVSTPLRDDPIFNNRAAPRTMRSEVEKRLSQVARSPGESPASKLSPIAKKTWKEAKDRVLTKEQQELVTPEHLKGQFEQWTLQLMEVDAIAALFQQRFRTQFAAAVLGTPYAEPTLCINAIHVLHHLSVHSLTEDQFGNVHRDVPGIIRTFTSVIKKLEAFRIEFPLHWTDVSCKRVSPEVEKVMDALKTALKQVLANFEPYSSDLRLTLSDIRLAKEACADAKNSEMTQVQS